ncbi:hypothetical protein [Amycolatopsis saalfeldensis]|uniref:Uncharacterized protein n=1 Tax=Amycolatopsis saalfeldensis TaxID=394193 RepID=A0A1H8YRC6_9PSEU|nr:hypothetical protein [Amycolatopsis saalfeldensis]SEP54561.1 hypothetical protein SAMN04489732_1566 [Amycolatopsis saalfeldensis]
MVLDRSLDDLPDEIAELARQWERHVVEADTGLPPDAPVGAVPGPPFDSNRTTVRERETARAAELTAAGMSASVSTVQRMWRCYRAEGLCGLVDSRAHRRTSAHGWTDEWVVSAIREAFGEQASRSTGTRDRLRRQMEAIRGRAARRDGAVEGDVQPAGLAVVHRAAHLRRRDHPPLGSEPTGRIVHVSWAARPGQQVQIGSAPLDVMAVFDDGQARRVELTAVDVATRTICAAIPDIDVSAGRVRVVPGRTAERTKPGFRGLGAGRIPRWL